MDIVTGTTEAIPSKAYSDFAKYRHRLFVEKLGWQLDSDGDRESDQFDGPHTVYVIAHSKAGRVVGGARLLPTTGPYLLAEVFPQLLHDRPIPRSRDVWELSRFAAADLDGPGAFAGQLSSPIAVGLLRATMNAASARGAKRLISVSPMGVERLLRKNGFGAYRAGPPALVGDHFLFACWIDLP